MRSRAKLLTTLAVLVLSMLFGAAAAAQEGAPSKYNNDMIFDGTVKESPLKLDFDVAEVRVRVNEVNQRYFDHYIDQDYDALVKNLKARYKSRKTVSPDVKIVGYIFLTQSQHWSFTLQQIGERTQYVMHVMPNETGQGSIIAVRARVFGLQSGYFKRSWFGSSPFKLKKHSVAIKAY